MTSRQGVAGLAAFASGLVFGIGLIAGGMTDPIKVKAFLDIAGAWDPSLALAMGGAVALALPAFALARRRKTAWSGAPIVVPTNTTIDMRLIGGGVLFGIGWGIAGFCPGPALAALSGGAPLAALFVAAMLGGMALHDRLLARRP